MCAEIDKFEIKESKLKGEVVSVGGSWSTTGDDGKPGPAGDFSFKPAFMAAIEATYSFERAMASVKRDVGLTPEQVKILQDSIINGAVDAEAMNEFRRRRVMLGHTDHRKLLEVERFKRGVRIWTRAFGKSRLNIGWLTEIRWRFPYVRNDWRPFDWAIDCNW